MPFASTPFAGWRRLPYGAGGSRDGVESAADGPVIHVNADPGDRPYAPDRARGGRPWHEAGDARDNLSRTRDGRYLVIAHRGSRRRVVARTKSAATCGPLAVSVVVAVPADGHGITVIEGGGSGVPVCAGTVAAALGAAAYCGSPLGDRIAATRRGPGMRP